MTSTMHPGKRYLTFLLLTILAFQAFGYIISMESSGTGYHASNLGYGDEMVTGTHDLTEARLQQLFAVDSALAHTYMTHVVVHSDAIMATDSFPVAVFCTSGRFEETSMALSYTELVSPQLADSINAIAGQNLLLLTMADYFDNDVYLLEKHMADIEELFRQVGMPVSAPLPSHEKEKMTLYPNPATGMVRLRAPFADGTPCIVRVVGLAGQTVYVQQLAYHYGLSLPLHDLPAGTYVVTVYGDGQRFADRLFLVR